ncbi:MAG TPA: hypothetical protein VMD99_15140 [Terriglobales bacterium]|nr:hypothetical protein [Terriglobales bacterium]
MPERKPLTALCVWVFAGVVFAGAVFASPPLARAQDDSPSLGDAARQARQQKLQETQSQAADAKADNNNNKGTPTKDAASTAPNPAAQNKEDAQSNDSKDSNSKDKDKSKDAQTPAAASTHQPKPKHVITNDDIPSSGGPTGYRPPPGPSSSNQQEEPADSQRSDGPKPAADWTSQIQTQKNTITALQDQIAQLSDSIQYAGANCVSNCAQWNEQQKQKQDQVESMKTQLEQAQKALEDMQNTARQQGYGSAVYDP